MKNSKLALSVAAASVFCSMILVSTAHAADCKKIKFAFYNDHGAQIKVRKVKIVGNDSTWTEDINNKKIDAGKEHTTNGRRLNGLDSGMFPKFTVIYDRLNKGTGGWYKDQKVIFDYADGEYEWTRCTDGKTYHFRLPNEDTSTSS